MTDFLLVTEEDITFVVASDDSQPVGFIAAPGPQGPPGPIGPSGTGDLSFVWQQTVAATTWTINHNLNKYPSVTVIDSGGNTWIAIPVYVGTTQLTLTWPSAMTGTAYLN